MVPNSNNHNLFSSDYPAFRWVQTIKDYIFECILYRGSRKRFFIIWRNNIYKEAWQFQSIQPSIGRSRSRNTSVAVEKAHSVEVCHCFVRDINAILSSYLHHILDIFLRIKGMWWTFSALSIMWLLLWSEWNHRADIFCYWRFWNELHTLQRSPWNLFDLVPAVFLPVRLFQYKNEFNRKCHIQMCSVGLGLKGYPYVSGSRINSHDNDSPNFLHHIRFQQVSPW